MFGGSNRTCYNTFKCARVTVSGNALEDVSVCIEIGRNETMIYDLMILGAGPAGISAAIYASRAKLNTLWLEKGFAPGGQILNTYEVDNYPGMPGIGGYDLGEAMAAHAEKLGISSIRENVTRIEDMGEYKLVHTRKNTYQTRTILAACGATHRKLGIPGEEEFGGMGVSYCATCDGAFFKERTVVVVGGGNVAAEDALFLARICKKVYLVHRREELRADKILQEKLFTCENVEILWDSVLTEIQGTEQVEAVQVENIKSGEKKQVETDGVFIAIGIIPNTALFEGLVKLDEGGYIVAGEEGITSTAGIFAAGDIRTKALRQVVTAVSDGANAVASVQKYLV